ncbi:MAG: viroplasmin family protein [Patescibacteria group bacterium]
MSDSKNFVIFTDGASRGNPGPGGWGAVVVESGKSKDESQPRVTELGGAEKHTTNNKMELNAAVQGISHTPQNSFSTLYTDSSYVINGITKWIAGWKQNGWKTKAKEDVLNKVLWMELDSCLENRMVSWKYVGGHVGIAGNERCDEIATAMADEKKIKLYDGTLSEYSIKGILNISYDPSKAAQKESSSSRSRAKAFSYISAVGGKVEIHQTWAECEKRVKGVRGARFKKALDKAEELAIRADLSK